MRIMGLIHTMWYPLIYISCGHLLTTSYMGGALLPCNDMWLVMAIWDI